MKQVGSLLWNHVAPFQVYGANTGVGKTVASTALLRTPTFQRRSRPIYIKPVSTGGPADEDRLHINQFVPNVDAKTLISFDAPVSPHLAARHSKSGTKADDQTVLLSIHDELVRVAAAKQLASPLVECAGGVLSPGPSGTPQADLYRPLRLPTVLVADTKLGGIATTISAWESLFLRGYDVLGVIMFKDHIYENFKYLTDYFADRSITAGLLDHPPPVSPDKALDVYAMGRYYDLQSENEQFSGFADKLFDDLQSRKDALASLPDRTMDTIWHPFMQHTERKSEGLLVVDSAYGDNFQTYQRADNVGSGAKLVPAFDGSASWWTQGLGHGNPNLALASAHAAGRYGHVMFANATHEPAVQLAEQLVYSSSTALANEAPKKLAKVFYTDNGSTGMEVAVKMALKASAKRYGWKPSDDIMVLGLKGSYHGDTIGVMDCSEGNVYNAKVEWYKGRGFWFDFPIVRMTKGKWQVVPPEGSDDVFSGVQTFDKLDDIFDLKNRTETSKTYAGVIDRILKHLVSQGNKFGALIMEPVILGAGGMLFCDPLFQHELWKATQRLDQGKVVDSTDIDSATGWTGMPCITDEVFTGLYRLGKRNSSDMIGVPADVTVYAKLLTGGLVPLATTVASDSMFNSFLSSDKADALLHGHSYTAHATGCMVALHSLQQYKQLNTNTTPNGWKSFKDNWSAVPTTATSSAAEEGLWSMWTSDFVSELSHRDNVDGVFAIGCVLAIELKDPQGAGYTSTASIGIRDKLMEVSEEYNQSIHCRVLGNVMYFMTSLTSSPAQIEVVQSQIKAALSSS